MPAPALSLGPSRALHAAVALCGLLAAGPACARPADGPAGEPAAAEPDAAAGPLVPRLDGPWVKLVGRPELERWASPEAEPVDFTAFRADDGTWQLISCVRKTTHPGATRLAYRWSSPTLTREGWTPEGIFLSSKPEWDHKEGLVQAPFHVRDGDGHFLFYNSRGAHLMTSDDGLTFEPYGTSAVFPMGRDLCVLDDRDRSGKWIAYYTSFEPGMNAATKDHTIRARTAERLTGPWSETAVEIPPITPPPEGYQFVYAESPFVLRRGDFYYRFEQLNVFRSADPLKWEGPPVARLAPDDPLKRLAPEVVTHDGKDYLLAYQWRGRDPRGIYLAPLAWDAAPAGAGGGATPLLDAADRTFRGLRDGTAEARGYRRDLALEALLRLARAADRAEYREFVFEEVRRSGLTPETPVSFRAQPFGSLTSLLAEESGDRAWLDVFLKESRAYRREIPRTPEGAITHPRGKARGGGDAVLIDALQEYAGRMARTGRLTGDEEYFEEAVRQFRLHRAIVRDPATGLWSQGRGWIGGEPDRLSPGAWSRGHGWLIRGMVETLRSLPPESAGAAELRGYLEELADALLPLQRPDGLWPTLLHRPPEDSPPEVSGTALIAGYLGIALADGFLEGDGYEAAARRAYAALPRFVRADGVIESVSPGPGPLEAEAPYAVAAFPPGEEHGPFALFTAATGERRLDARAPEPAGPAEPATAAAAAAD